MVDWIAAAGAGSSIVLILWGAALCLYEAFASPESRFHDEHLKPSPVRDA
jgi:hypothetical protein